MAGFFYRSILRRNSTFWAAILATAFVGELAFDYSVDALFDAMNRGKQWKDIEEQYAKYG